MTSLPPADRLDRGQLLLELTETLDPQPTSPGRARRLLREALAQAERDAWIDAAVLAISEVVTNAALHAHASVEVHISVYAEEVCVEVRDASPALPALRNYGSEATTGRGLGLVAAVSRACGVQSLGRNGKVVWFCVGEGADEPSGVAGAEWNLAELVSPDDGPDGMSVQLLAMPATLWLSARQHHDGILRELLFFLADRQADVLDLASADAARLTISSALIEAVEAAQAAGRARPPVPSGHPSPLPWVPPHLDLTLSIDPATGPSYAALQDVLDMAEALALDGQLLTRPGLPEIVAVRDWACEQVIAQLSGSPAAPWPGTAQERFETAVNHRSETIPEWDSTVVSEATTLAVAADEANRIIAVSRPLAELVGWSVDELVGRRVVTLIPPAMREAHVAGFSRHLSTGESHVLGIPLDLPVLHRDGSERVFRFLISRNPDASGRAVYVAWLELID